MIIVLNEWVFHDLLGDNGHERRRQTRAFMDAFESSGDKLVIPNEDRWTGKAKRLMLRQEAEGKAIGKLIHRIIWNPELAIRFETDAALVPDDLLRETPRKDVYLVEAYLHGLHGALADFGVVECLLRDDFLAGYRRPPDA